MSKEYMVVNEDLKNEIKEDYYVTSVWDVYEKSKKQMSWDLFKKSIKMKNLETKRLEEIPDINNLKEHTILVTPILAQSGKITQITSQLLNERGDDFKDGVKSGYYVYSKNYGWIDRTHAGFTTRIKKLKQLYTDILKAKKGDPVTYMMESGGPLGIKISRVTMQITINMDIVGIENKEERTKFAQGITLSIFKKTSREAENAQGWTDWYSQSSNAEEDLPSNILNFYFEVIGYSEEKIRDICKCFSKKQSLWIYHKYKFIKNDDFPPILRYPGAVFPSDHFDAIKEIEEDPDTWTGKSKISPVVFQ